MQFPTAKFRKNRGLNYWTKTSACNKLKHCLILDGCSANSSSSVRNLGVLFDGNLSFENHVSNIYKTAFSKIYLNYDLCVTMHTGATMTLAPPVSNAETLIHAFMTSRLDYCNALLGGCSARLINKLQLVQNTAARVLTRTRTMTILARFCQLCTGSLLNTE